MKNKTEKKFNLDLSQYVCTKNEFCFLGEKLSLNELKLLRLCIMQIAREDEEFYSYQISLTELANILGVKRNNLSRDLPKMCVNLMSNLVHIQIDSVANKWKVISWCTCCSYEDGILTMKLNEMLAPYFLKLQGCFNRYPLESVITLKTGNAIKIYELITSKILENEVYADKTKELNISYAEIKKVTNTEDKYTTNNTMYRKRIIEPAIEAINSNEHNSLYMKIIKPDGPENKLVDSLHIKVWSKTGYRVSKKEEV